MPLNSDLSLNVRATLTSTLDLAEASVPLQKTYKTALTSGVAAGQADVTWHDTRTVNASSNDDLDLAGVLAGLLGGTVTLVKIKALIVHATAANAQNFTFGAAAANPWVALLGATGTVTMRPDSTFAHYVGEADAAGYAVIAGTGDILRVANGAGVAISYDIIVIGTSA